MTIREDFKDIFVPPSFSDMFLYLNQQYANLDFKDDISDNERISEYKWIATQFSKYISKQESVIMKHEDRDGMLAEVINLIEKTQEYGKTRMEIVYNIIRDEWLRNFYSLLEVYQEEDND